MSALRVLLLAERARLLPGRADEFVAVVTLGFTGIRWGVLVGLEMTCVRKQAVRVEWQLYELDPQRAPQPVLADLWPGIRCGGEAARADACWLPIAPGLTPHGSVQALYPHVTDGMIRELLVGLTRLWEEALAQRRLLSPRSPVAVLDRLLTGGSGNENRAPSRWGETRSDLLVYLVGDTGIEPVTSSVSTIGQHASDLRLCDDLHGRQCGRF